MMCKVSALAIVMALVAVASTEAYTLHLTTVAHRPWQRSTPQRAVDLQATIQMNIALKRRNVDRLEQILLDVSDPASLRYGEHLNDEQMTQLVSPGADVVEAVKSWLALHGIDKVEVARHQDAIKFQATRAQVSALLKVQWATYDNTVTHQTTTRALTATQIPAHLEDAIEIIAGHRGWPMALKPESAQVPETETLAEPVGGDPGCGSLTACEWCTKAFNGQCGWCESTQLCTWGTDSGPKKGSCSGIYVGPLQWGKCAADAPTPRPPPPTPAPPVTPVPTTPAPTTAVPPTPPPTPVPTVPPTPVPMTPVPATPAPPVTPSPDTPVPIPPAPAPTGPCHGSNQPMSVTPSVLDQVYNISTVPLPAGVRNPQAFTQFEGQFVESSDLSAFCEQFLPGHRNACKISKFIGNQNGPVAGDESSLDAEYIIATSKLSETWVYTYNGMDFCSDLLTWSQDVFQEGNNSRPNVISMSYGNQHLPTYCEGTGAQRMNVDTMKMGAMGISVIIASGDMGSGYYSRQGFNGGYLSPSFPAELPYVTSVGSTTFESGNCGTERGTKFSGGGLSYLWPTPGYQKAAVAYYGDHTTIWPHAKWNVSGRACPDVSVLGEKFNIIYKGQKAQVAGTSASTPSFAGMITQLNNLRLQNGKTLGFLNPLLYSNADGFTDITTGNSNSGHEGMGWQALAGWDPVTGLGTPRFGRLTEIVEGLNARENDAPRARLGKKKH